MRHPSPFVTGASGRPPRLSLSEKRKDLCDSFRSLPQVGYVSGQAPANASIVLLHGHLTHYFIPSLTRTTETSNFSALYSVVFLAK